MARSRAPYVAVQTDLVKDERVSALADAGGYNVYEARGRLVTLWAWCVDRRLQDAPEGCDGYAVSEAVVRRFMGPRGVEAILADGCDELALAVRRPDGLLYLRGTSEYVAHLRALVVTARAGGSARAASGRDEDGRFVSAPTNVQPSASRQPAVSQPSDQPQSSRNQRSSNSYNQQPTRDLVRPEERVGSPASPELPLVDLNAKVELVSRTRKKPVGPMPPRWIPREQEIAKALELGVGVEREAERFRNHHAAKGSVFADWDAAFRNWVDNACKYAAKSRNGHDVTVGRVEPSRPGEYPEGDVLL